MVGYDTGLFLDKPVNEDFICHVCHSVFEKPMSVCAEGHTFCDKCLTEWKKRSNSCPQCRTDMHAIPVLNRIVQNMILNMQVKCPEVRSEPDQKRAKKEPEKEDEHDMCCGWEGTLADYVDKHKVKECRFAQVKCTCKQMIRVYHLEQHLANDCPCRQVHCELCNKSMIYSFLKRHVRKQCPKSKVNCTDCGEEMERQALGSKRLERNEHDTNHWKYTGHMAQCPKMKVECAFHSMGCTTKIPREDLKQHHADFGDEHAKLVSAQIQTLREDHCWTPRTMHWKIMKSRLQALYDRSVSELKSQDIVTGDYRCYLRLKMGGWNKVLVHVCVKDYELTPRIDRMGFHWTGLRTNQLSEDLSEERYMKEDPEEESVACAGGSMKLEVIIDMDVQNADEDAIPGWVPLGVDMLLRSIATRDHIYLIASFRLASPECVKVEEER